jgi:2-oxo-4-hydroxy-4-carboxy-5-ureidoimidazoline decarboxylase
MPGFMNLDQLNHLPTQDAWTAFERCCGASAWVEHMCGARPFRSPQALAEAAERGFELLGPDDWREAFAHHPRIGDVAALREKFAATAHWAGDEQKGASSADDATIEALAAGNRDYEARFGFIFIVCATGKSASEMLALLQARLPQKPETELKIAAEEQRKITRLRLEKLLAE